MDISLVIPLLNEEENVEQLYTRLTDSSPLWNEDYEILFTIDITDLDKIKGQDIIHPIGHIADKEHGAVMITSAGQSIPLQAQGWNPMKKKD